jgi:biopolymer transport protein ExbD
MGMQAGSGGGPQADINITPLVDVVLVLLIIFMVITPMLQSGQAVVIPEAPHAINKKQSEDDLVVTVTPDKRVWLGEELVDEQSLVTRLQNTLAYQPFVPILIKGDTSLVYEDIKPVMRACADAGAKSVGLMTDKNTMSQPGVAERRVPKSVD